MIPSAPLGTDAAADRSGLGAAAGSPARAGSNAGEATPSPRSTAERRFRFELAAHPGSVAQARRLTRARLSGWAVCADTCDSAALVISELVTNAIVHTASGRVVCELHDHDDMVRIAVRDEGCAPGEPHPSPQRPDEEHGRGLLLVDALCRAWGAQEHGPGLLVWAELPRQDDTAQDTAEPRDDLGWGARPKPGRPDDSDDDRPAEASGRVAQDERRGTAPGQHRDAVREGRRDAVREEHRDPASGRQRDVAFGQLGDTAREHRRDAVPEQQRRTPRLNGPGKAGQLGPGGAGQLGPGVFAPGALGQLGPGTPSPHGRGEPEQHRHLPAGQPAHRLPEQHGYGAAEQHPHAAHPGQHRLSAPDQPPHHAPASPLHGERP